MSSDSQFKHLEEQVNVTIEQSQSWIDQAIELVIIPLVETNMYLALILAVALTHGIKILTPLITDRVTQKYDVWHGYWYLLSMVCGALASLIFLWGHWGLLTIVVFITGVVLDTLPHVPPKRVTCVFKTATDRSFDPKSEE